MLMPTGDSVRSESRLRIASLALAYPSVVQPGLGVFIRSRLRAMTGYAEVRVLAPVPLFAIWKPGGVWEGLHKLPPLERDGGLEVRRPRWGYMPGAGVLHSILLFLQMIGPLRRLRREFDFDLIDAHFAHPEGIAAAFLSHWMRRPFTITIRGCEVDHAKPLLRRCAMRWAMKRAVRVIAVSARLSRFAISLGADPSRTITVPNGVDTAVFYPRDREECRRRHALPQGRKFILSAAVWMPLKGQLSMVRALRRLIGLGYAVDLVLAGNQHQFPGYADLVLAEIATSGLQAHVHCLGHIAPELLAELMSAADVFCLASNREGWPNVVHEAQACGLPSVSTDVGGIPDMIPDPSYGIIVPIDDQTALEGALARALDTAWDREAIVRWGRARSWDQVGQEVVREMKTALDEVAAPAERGGR